MATRTKKGSKKGKKEIFSRGMSKEQVEKGSYGDGNTVFIKKGGTAVLQFLTDPDDFLVFQQHSWEEKDKWYFVPCTGEDCPLCEEEDEDISKTGYQFAAQVYNIKEKKAQVLKGGKDLGGRVYHRFERAPNKFVKRTLEVTKFATRPVSFEVSPGEDKPVNPDKIEAIDLEEWFQKEVDAYFGEKGKRPKASDLDDDEDEDDEDEDEDDEDLDDDDEDEDDDDEDEDEEDEDDDEDDDDDDEDDDDEDEDDDPPAKPSKKPAKRKPAKRKPAKRKPAKKRGKK